MGDLSKGMLGSADELSHGAEGVAMWEHRGKAILAAVIVAASLGAHAAPAAEPCGEWGPYPPPTGVHD